MDYLHRTQPLHRLGARTRAGGSDPRERAGLDPRAPADVRAIEAPRAARSDAGVLDGVPGRPRPWRDRLGLRALLRLLSVPGALALLYLLLS